MRHIIRAAVVVLPLLVAACTSKQEQTRRDAIGDWVYQTTPTKHITLADGGAFRGGDVANSGTLSGTWTVSETGGIALVNPEENQTFAATLQNGHLLLTEPDGTQDTLIRAVDVGRTIPSLSKDEISHLLYNTYDHECLAPVRVHYEWANDPQQLPINLQHVTRDFVGPDKYDLVQSLDNFYAYQERGVSMPQAPDSVVKLTINPSISQLVIDFCQIRVMSNEFKEYTQTDTSPLSKRITYSWATRPTAFSTALSQSTWAAVVAMPTISDATRYPIRKANIIFKDGKWQLGPS